MSQTKAQLLDNIKDNVQLDARNSLRFADTDSSHYVAFKAPATVSSNVTWTLPAADGSANYVLATDGSGTLSWIADPAGQWTTSGSNIYFTGGNVGIGDSSPSNPLSVTGASAFNGDVTFTGASYNATWDKSDNSLEFSDGARATFGTGADLRIYHTGGNSYINNATGNLLLEATSNGEIGIKIIPDGAVELYHDNSIKTQTNAQGILVGGDVDNSTSTQGVAIQTAGKIRSRVADASADAFIVSIEDSGASKVVINGAGNGYFVGGLDVPDSAKIQLGTGDDLQLYHDGTNSYVHNDNGSGWLYIQGDAIALRTKSDSNEIHLTTSHNGPVTLYHNNVRTLFTTASGAAVYGPEGGSGVLEISSDEADNNADIWRLSASASASELYIQNYASGSWETSIKSVGNAGVELYYDNSLKFYTNTDGVRVDDNTQIQLGSGGDFILRHNGSNSFIENYTGNLILRPKLNEEGVIIRADGAVELYYDNNIKLSTNTAGVKIDNGNLLLDRDNALIKFGASNDLAIYHSSSNNIIECANGMQLHINKGDTENMAKFIPDGAVELYWDNTKHFETNAGGVKVNDSLYMGFGNSNDLQISHNATDSTILNQTGNLRVRTTGDLYLQVNGGSNENAIVAKTNSSVDIYYDNNKKFNTDPDGVQVTGILQAHLNISDSDFTAHDWHVLQSNDNGKAAVIVEHSGDNNAYGLVIAFTDDNPDNNTNYFINCYDTTNTRFKVYSDGDVVNNDNSYGSTSDVKLKENIVDAGSQWDDIKAVKVRNFNFKTDTPSDKRLGVIAQELETVSPGLVSDDPDLDKNNNNLGTTTKSVKYSILYMKAIKALQEAMAKIETLETKVAALESA